MSRRGKRPAFMFYPADHRKDPGVQVCSLAARGLWVEMLCIMHEAEPYGHLCVNGRPISPDQLARMVGGYPEEVGALLSELEDAGVFSRTEEDAIHSRRMIRDEHIRNVRSAAGSKGGNPALLKQRDKQRAEQKPTLSSSPSSSPSREVSTTPPPPTEERAGARGGGGGGDASQGGDGDDRKAPLPDEIEKALAPLAEERVRMGLSNTMRGAVAWLRINYRERGPTYRAVHGEDAPGGSIRQVPELGISLPEKFTPQVVERVQGWVRDHEDDARRLLEEARQKSGKCPNPGEVEQRFVGLVKKRLPGGDSDGQRPHRPARPRRGGGFETVGEIQTVPQA